MPQKQDSPVGEKYSTKELKMDITDKMDMYLFEGLIPKKIAKWAVSMIKDKKILLKMVDGFVSEYKKRYPDGIDKVEKDIKGMINSGQIKNGLEFAQYVMKKY